MAVINTVSALEAIVGKTPAMMRDKAIDHLDEGTIEWINASPLMFASFGGGSVVQVTIGGGAPGWAIPTTKELRLASASLDDPALAVPGLGFGSIFLIPSIREVMRVNGTVLENTGSEIIIQVDECFFHCGKALIRSEFWKASPIERAPEDISGFVRQSQFMALTTVNDNGRADVSPKGDKPGTMAIIEDGRLWFADRPGNKRVDSFRNILTQPRVAGVLLIPGSPTVVRLGGTATITTNEKIRKQFAVRDKIPSIVTAVEDLAIDIGISQTLKRIGLWPASAAPEHISPMKIALGHGKSSKKLGSRLASKAFGPMSGLVQKGLEHDYKKNLF